MARQIAKVAKLQKQHKYNVSDANINKQAAYCIQENIENIHETFINSVAKRVERVIKLGIYKF